MTDRFDFGVLILLAALAGCAHEEAPLTVPRIAGVAGTAGSTMPARDWSGPATADGIRGRPIDAIIYADLSNEEMLRRLAPYVEGFGTKEGFEKTRGVGPASCVGMGPGATSCTVPDSGLELIYDPNGVLRVMRRQARTLGGRSYAASPLTGPGFEWSNYRQRFGY